MVLRKFYQLPGQHIGFAVVSRYMKTPQKEVHGEDTVTVMKHLSSQFYRRDHCQHLPEISSLRRSAHGFQDVAAACRFSHRVSLTLRFTTLFSFPHKNIYHSPFLNSRAPAGRAGHQHGVERRHCMGGHRGRDACGWRHAADGARGDPLDLAVFWQRAPGWESTRSGRDRTDPVHGGSRWRDTASIGGAERTGVAAVNGPGVDQTPEGVQEHLHLPRASRRRHPPDLGRGGRRSPLGAGEATGLVPTLSTRDALG